jgi:hypothetical protein
MYLTSSSREKCTGFTDPTVFSKSGKGLRKKLKKKQFICLRTPDLTAFSAIFSWLYTATCGFEDKLIVLGLHFRSQLVSEAYEI